VDHGSDYLAFFRRIGDTVLYLTARDDHSAEGIEGGSDAGGRRRLPIVATACALLRDVPGAADGGDPVDGERAAAVGGIRPKAWYIGDLRVAPSHRGRHLSEALFIPVVQPMLARCGSAFAVEMVPTPDAVGRMPRMVQACRPDLPVAVHRLELWSLSAAVARRAWGVISRAHGGPRHATFVDLGGVKDLRLVPSGEPLQVLHLIDRRRLKPGDKECSAPEEGARHLLCSVTGGASRLGETLRAGGEVPFAYALAVHLAMDDNVDWESLSTAEI